MSPAIQKDKDDFLASVTDRWGQRTTIKVLRQGILNLVPLPTNYDPWEDEDGPLFSKLDDKLEHAHANTAKDGLINSDSLLGIHMSWPGPSARNMIPTFCPSALPTNNLPWAPISMKSIF